MQYFAFLPVILSLLLDLRCLLAWLHRKRADDANRIDETVWLFLGSLPGEIFVIPTYHYILGGEWLKAFITGFNVALCWGLQWKYVNCWMRFDEEGFIHHTVFGRTLRFRYEDVTGYRRTSEGNMRFYCGSHSFTIDRELWNCKGEPGEPDPLRHLKRRKGHISPMSARWDPYNHNVRYSWLLFSLFLFLLLLLTAVTAATLIGYFSAPEPEEAYERREVVFTDWRQQKKSNDLCLTAADGTEYGIEAFVHQVNPNEICDGETLCTVWVKGSRPLWIVQLYAGEQPVLTLAQYRQSSRSNKQIGFWLLPLLWGMILWFFIRTLQIGRHPERYSKKLRRRYFGKLLEGNFAEGENH